MSKLYIPPYKRRQNAKNAIKPSTKFMKETKVDIAQDKRLTKLEKKVKKITPESKYLDLDTGNATYYAHYEQDTSGPHSGLVVFTSSALMPSGSGEGQHDGNKITPTSFQLRLDLTKPSGSASVGGRIIIFQADVSLDYSTGSPVVDYNETYKILKYVSAAPFMLNSPYNKASNFRYHILYDRIFALNSNNLNKVLNIKIKGSKMKPIYWEDVPNGAGGFTNLESKNQLYMLFIDNVLTAPGNTHIAYKFISRLTYQDS